MSKLIVRRAGINDAEACARVFAQTLAATFPDEPDEVRTADAYRRCVIDEEQWVATFSGKIIGFISIYWPGNFVHSLFVLPDFQGRGAGSALLAVVRSRAKGDLELKVDLSNVAALLFYRRLGWREVGEGAGVDGVWLRLRWSGGVI